MMKEKKWVQHISGHGEKWEVVKERSSQWGCKSRDDREPWLWLWLPKSEYPLCEPPPRWVDVTDACEVDADGYITHNWKRIEHYLTYRAKKMQPAPQGHYFIIEQRVLA